MKAGKWGKKAAPEQAKLGGACGDGRAPFFFAVCLSVMSVLSDEARSLWREVLRVHSEWPWPTVSNSRRKPYRRANPRRLRKCRVSERPEGDSQSCSGRPQGRPRRRALHRPRCRRRLRDHPGAPGSRGNRRAPRPRGTNGAGGSNRFLDKSVKVPTQQNVAEPGRKRRRTFCRRRKSEGGGNEGESTRRTPRASSTQPFSRKNLSGMQYRNVRRQAGRLRNLPTVHPAPCAEAKNDNQRIPGQSEPARVRGTPPFQRGSGAIAERRNREQLVSNANV